MKIIGESSEGIIEFNDGNELFVDSKIDDPAKVRIGMQIYPTGSGGGAHSFDALVNGNVNQREELAMIHGEQSDLVRGNIHNYTGQLAIHIRDGSAAGDGMVKVVLLRHNDIILAPAIVEALRRQLGNVAGGGDVLIANNGKYRLYMQGDGNLVVYNPDGTARWDAGCQEKPQK